MKVTVLDCETDDLAYSCSKIHVMSWTNDGDNYLSTCDYNEMRHVIESSDLVVCHNGVRFDQVVFNRILGIPMDYRKWVDTLSLSWYLYPERNKHGLGPWGDDLGVEKPTVENWTDVTYEQMRHRCESDCAINWKLWKKMEKRLEEIYK